MIKDEYAQGMTQVDCQLTLNELALIVHHLVNSGDLTSTEASLLEKIEAYETKGMRAYEKLEEDE